jgi:hypothetical protein
MVAALTAISGLGVALTRWEQRTIITAFEVTSGA